MKKDFRINIDALEITYISINEAKKKILEGIEIGESRLLGMYNEMKIIRNESRYYKYEFTIMCKDKSTAIHDRCVGTLYFGTYNKNRPNIYFSFDNKAFYDWVIEARMCIEEALDLQFLRISKLDIAADFNFNIEKRLIRAYKNTDYTLIVNGKVADDKCVYGVGFLSYWNPRHRIFANPQMIIDSEDNNFSMRTYNKKKEIEQKSGKTYIQENSGFKSICYRIEVSCTSYKKIRPTILNLGISDEDLYAMLTNENMKIEVFKDILNRLIRLRKGRKIRNIIDVALDY